MPKFIHLDKSLQGKVRMMEEYANTIGRDSQECNQLWKELKDSKVACFSLNQKDGVFSACLRPVVEGRNRCEFHGGKTRKGEELTPAQKLAIMNNLRPRAVQHGWYAEESSFIASLTEEEIKYMAFLEKTVREQYEVKEGLEELYLEEILQNAIIHMRMVNRGIFERGSRHTARPLQETLKTIEKLGWTRKQTEGKVQFISVSDKYLSMLDNYDFEDDKKLN